MESKRAKLIARTTGLLLLVVIAASVPQLEDTDEYGCPLNAGDKEAIKKEAFNAVAKR